jgi:hypothetical protein
MSVWQKGVHYVGEGPPPYAPEIRLEAVRLVRVGGVVLKDVAATVGA